MDLIMLVLVLCVIGFVVYLLTTYIPMPPNLGKAIQVVALVLLILYLVSRVVPLPNVLR